MYPIDVLWFLMSTGLVVAAWLFVKVWDIIVRTERGE